MHAVLGSPEEEEDRGWRAQSGPGDAGEGQGGDHLHPRAPRAPQPEAQARLRQDHRAEPVQVGNHIIWACFQFQMITIIG